MKRPNLLRLTVSISYGTGDGRQDKQVGALVPTSPVLALLNAIYREPVSKGRPKLALPSGPIDKPQYITQRSPRWNHFMVHPRQHIQEVEREQFTLVDLRQTYVFLSLIFHQIFSFSLTTWLYSRVRKEYFMVSHMRNLFWSTRSSHLPAQGLFNKSRVYVTPDWHT